MKSKTKKNGKTPVFSPVYDKEDYKSNDGMLTKIWGACMWHYLHTMSFNYPVNPSIQQKQHYRNFILSLKNVLPCGKCRENFKKNLKHLPLIMSHMKSRDSFSKYVYELHEVVNKMLGKNSKLTYEEVRERYEHFRARCRTEKKITDLGKPKKENGCVVPLVGKKSKCILKIVPDEVKCEALTIDKKCNAVKLFPSQPKSVHS